MEFSSLMNRISEPATLKMARLGRELSSKGINIVSLSLGEPDFNTPDHIKEAARKAIDENYSHYTPVTGYLESRKAVVHKLQRDNNLIFKPEQVVITTGAKQAIADSMFAALEPGKEIIIPTPYWVSYSEIAKTAGGNVVLVNTKAENGFKITPDELENAITPKTRMFIFSSPCNPSGAVYSRDELYGLARVFEKHPDIFIVSDEIYEYIDYTGNGHQSIGQFDFIRDRVIVINGLSKAFAMTGWRVGYLASTDAKLVKSAEIIQGQFTSGTNSIAQRALITALTTSLDPSFEMVKQFRNRKEKVMELVKTLPGIKCTEPGGAFYIFPDVSSYFGKSCDGVTINNSDDMTMYLLNNAHVSTVSGNAFGCPGHIRLSFANSLENIEEGFRRIKEHLGKLS